MVMIYTISLMLFLYDYVIGEMQDVCTVLLVPLASIRC